MTLPDSLSQEVRALRKEGRHSDAAERCRAAGHVREAVDLLVEVWEYERAMTIAEEAGLLDVAYGVALDARNRPAADRLCARLAESPDQALRAAAVAEQREATWDAARLREAAGELDPAAQLYEEAGSLFEAARCHDAAGRYRQAGVLYERRVKEAPEDSESALCLGRILAQFGRHEHAVRALQRVPEGSGEHRSALVLLVACFDALGMSDAAMTALSALRRLEPSTPGQLEPFLEHAFGDRGGLRGKSYGEDNELLAGRYRVVRALGAGATGRVVLAHDAFHERMVAIKLLSVGGGAYGRDAYAHFAREARVAAGLDHPNVVHVHEFNAEGPFLVMEFMAGGTLEEKLVASAPGGLPLGAAGHVLTSTLAGLEAVHRRGVVHRDLKPANLFFGPAGEVKIGDFGVAHLADLGATLTGALIGTLAYMAPEQITGERPPDASTDLYALGVVAYRMLTGLLPFPGPDFLTQHLEHTPPPPSAARPGLAQVHDALVSALLQKDPAARPRSATEVLERVRGMPFHEPTAPFAVAAPPAMAGPPEPRASDSIPPPAHDARYVVNEAREHGVAVVRDGVLERLVLSVPCGPVELARLRVLARADCPFLQAVFDVDDDRGVALLELPAGVAPSAETWPDGAVTPELARLQLGAALRSLHACGLVHGQVDAAHVRVGPGRAVLLLPRSGELATDPSVDQRALDALFR